MSGSIKLTLTISILAAGVAGTGILAAKPATAMPYSIAQRCDNNNPTRIQFAPGTQSTLIVSQSSDCNSIKHYVLRAYAGQKMTVNTYSPDYPIPLYLTIYGADGTILVRDVVQNSSWSGRLPSTEDYYINVVSSNQFMPDYNLNVSIQ
ncbi:MAG: hypothetical protein ACAF41_28165 [Leptolyngbya sp. BL-A-14]